jgi:PAS domain S-box-containing protein
MSGFPIDQKQKSLATLLYADKVAMVYRLAPLSVISTPFIGLFAWWTAWSVSAAPSVNIWFISLLVICFCRAMLIRAYRKAPPSPEEAPRWGRRFIISIFALGALWGLAGGILFSTGDPLARLVLAFLLPGIAAAGIGTLGPLKSSYYAFLLPLVTPLAIHLVLSGDVAFTGLGVSSAAFAFVLMAATARYSRTIAESLQLRFEKFALLDSLSRSTERLEWANTCLQREVSERANAESIAKEQSRRLEWYIEQTPLAIIETDLQYRVVAWNPAAESMFGYKHAEMIGKDVMEALTPRDVRNDAYNFIADLMSGKQAGSGPLQLLTRGGRMIVGELHVSVIHDNVGNAIGFAAAVQDITERRQIDRMKNEFITTVSHELHGPLQAMRTATESLMNGAGGRFESQAVNLLRSIQSHCERLTGLTESILDVERMDSGPGGLALQPLSLANLARRAVGECDALAELREVCMSLIEPAVDAIVEGDEDRLLRALTSLIHNAIKSSPEGGRIQVSLSVTESQAHLSIADRRAATPSDFQMRVMKKFSSAENHVFQNGSDISLGLYVSKRLVEKHGGKFSFESFHNVGNTFHIELPLLPLAANTQSFNAVV